MNSRRIQSQEAGLKYFVLGAFLQDSYYMESLYYTELPAQHHFQQSKISLKSRTNK